MDPLLRIAGRRIRRAMGEGAFDDLPGRGSPLELAPENPFEGTRGLAHKLLSSNGFAPRWIELDRELRAEGDRIRRQWNRLLTRPYDGGDPAEAWTELRALVDDHNRPVELRNALAPYQVRPRFPIRFEPGAGQTGAGGSGR